MEIKAWTYEEYPGYSEEVPGAVRLKTTGDEVGVRYLHDVEYARVDDVPLHLQILLPFIRNEPDKIYPCMVFIQDLHGWSRMSGCSVPCCPDWPRRGM